MNPLLTGATLGTICAGGALIAARGFAAKPAPLAEYIRHRAEIERFGKTHAPGYFGDNPPIGLSLAG